MRAGWSVTDTIHVGDSWVSGYYMAIPRFTAGTYAGRGYQVPFLVRPVAARASSILVQASVNTWQAYNDWGGKSLYASLSTGGVPADRVSFDRPYSRTSGNTTPLKFEIQLVRWLEREGIDATYQTDLDTDRRPYTLKETAAVVVNGHGEYWTGRMRDAFDAARDAGQDLLFAGANIGYWQVRYEDNYRTIVGYKERPDPNPEPAARTKKFRDLGRPECRLVGVQFDGAHQPGPGYTVLASPMAAGWLAGSGLSPGDQLSGTVDYEWDHTVSNCVTAPLETMLDAASAVPRAQATVYRSAAGGRVVAWGSLGLKVALDGYTPRTYAGPTGPVDPRFQSFMANLLRDFASAGIAR